MRRPARLTASFTLAALLAGCGGAGSSTTTTTGNSSATQGSSGSAPSGTGGASSSGTRSSTGGPGSTSSTGTVAASTSAASTSTPSTHGAGCAETVVAAMDDRQRAGQLLMAALTPDAGQGGLDGYVRDQALGNAFYLGGWQGRETVAAASAHLQEVAPSVDGHRVGMLVAADQEGGEVQQLTGEGFPDLPAAVAQGRWDRDRLTDSSRELGEALAAAGVNVDLAPVADTVAAPFVPRNDPIGALGRHYGTTPAAVSEDVAAVSAGLTEAGVLPTVKHFPGLGRVSANTDFAAESITDEVTDGDDPYLRPFADAVDEGAPLVMVSTARYPRLDEDQPAAFSEAVVTDLLREELGFEGVVITDDLGAASSVQDVPAGERATRVIAAGGDVVITADPTLVPAMSQALVTAAQEDPEFAAKVERSATRVLELKAEHGLLSCG